MPRIFTETIFEQLFSLVQTVQGLDWAGNVQSLVYSSRNWVKPSETPVGAMPALYQLDPMAENDVRTGLGRTRRKLHALVDIRIQRQQPDQYPDVISTGATTPPGNSGPFSVILNNWADNLYSLFSPADGGPQILANAAYPTGVVSDCYPTRTAIDYGTDASRVAVIYAQIELITGG